MKVLLIGGTGTISMAITRRLAARGDEVLLLNRGNRADELPDGVKTVCADISDEALVRQKLGSQEFDAVCEFVGFERAHVERDFRLFAGRTRQYMFISSASAYQKPLANFKITESTPLANPFWEYSRKKIDCENFLMQKYREESFPVTIIRPSHTYDERKMPVAVHGKNGSWQVLKRMLDGKPVIVHGDGSSLWTLTHNSDFAKGFVGLVGNIHSIGEAFQITSDESLTWNQIYSAIARALGVDFKPCYAPSDFLAATSDYDLLGNLIGDKAASVVFDNSKLKRAVPDFVATVRFDHGASLAVQYILSHKECQIPDPDFDGWCDRVVSAMEKAKRAVIEG